jgi:hypothetical protein
MSSSNSNNNNNNNYKKRNLEKIASPIPLPNKIEDIVNELSKLDERVEKQHEISQRELIERNENLEKQSVQHSNIKEGTSKDVSNSTMINNFNYKESIKKNKGRIFL